jgi:hypothetical protein
MLFILLRLSPGENCGAAGIFFAFHKENETNGCYQESTKGVVCQPPKKIGGYGHE